MSKFVHIGFGFAGVPKILDLEPVFSEMGDWIRYSNSGWLVWTDWSVKRINAKLVAHIDDEDHYIITAVEKNQVSAIAPKWIWEWIVSKMPEDSFTLFDPPSTKAVSTLPGGKKQT